MFQDPFSVPVTLIGGERTKCDRCGGDGQCKTCGGQGEIEERPHVETDTLRSDTSTASGKRHSSSKETETELGAEEPSGVVSGLAGLGAPIGGLAGGGGGVGGTGAGIFSGLLSSMSAATGIPGPALLLLFIVGLYLGWSYKKSHPEHYEIDIAVLDADSHHPIRFLEYTPGTRQRINLSITWQGGLQSKKRPFVLSLLRDSKTVFTRQIESEDKGPLGFYLPYDSEFQPGRYVAQVSVEGVGTRDYDFAVGIQDVLGGIDLGDPPVQPARENGLTIFLTDSFQGSHPWPPKNVIYEVPTEPKWLYATVQSGALSGGKASVNTTVICGASPLVTQPSEIKPNSTVYFPLEQKLMAGRCVERVFLSNGAQVEFPFIVVEVERGSNPGEYKIIQDPDTAPMDVSSVWLQRGIAHSSAGQHDAAIGDFNVEIPDEITAYQLRGNEYAALGAYERAITDYNYTLRWQPHNVWCLVSRGSAYANLGNYERAIADFKEAVRINPQYQDALERLTRAQQALAAQGMTKLDCYVGEWYDNVGNLWVFTQDGGSLHLHRPTDGTDGTFNWTGTQWQGSVWLPGLKISSGLTFQTIDDSCTKLKTKNGAMYFVRTKGE